MSVRKGLFAACLALLALLVGATCLGAAPLDAKREPDRAKPQVAKREPDRAKPQVLTTHRTLPLVVADLDGDHIADVAVESRTGNSSAGYTYRIDVGLSGWTQSSSFTVFDARATGLHVSTVDVDGDRDLDLVVNSQPIRHPIGVWINDGTGQFRHGEPGRYAVSIWTEPHLLQSASLPTDGNSSDTVQRRTAFHLFTFTRNQIPNGSCRASRLPQNEIPLRDCPKLSVPSSTSFQQ